MSNILNNFVKWIQSRIPQRRNSLLLPMNHRRGSYIATAANNEIRQKRSKDEHKWNMFFLKSFVFGGCFCLFLPYFLGYDLGLNDSPLDDMLNNSQIVKTTSAIALGVTIPILFEQLTSSYKSPHYIFRLLLIILYDIPYIWIAFGLQFHNSTCLYVCFFLSTIGMIGGKIMVSLYDLQKKMFPIYSVFFFSSCWTISCLLEILQVAYRGTDSEKNINPARLFFRAITYLAFLIFPVLLTRNAYIQYKQSKEPWLIWVKKVDSKMVAAISIAYILLMYMIILLANSIQIGFPGLALIKPSYYVIVAIDNCLLLMLMAYFPHKILALDTLKVRSDLDNKVAIVRYVSHELRTPLNVIEMGLVLLETKLRKMTGGGEQLADLVKEITASSRRSMTVVEDLVAYQQMEKNPVSTRGEDICLVQLIRDTAEQFALQASVSEVYFIILPEFPADVSRRYFTFGEEGKLMHALGNFMYQAISFTPKAGRVEVTLCGVTVADEEISLIHSSSPLPVLQAYRIKVIDTGTTVTTEEIERIMGGTLLFNNKVNRSSLPVIVAKALMESQRGKLSIIRDEILGGTTFYIDLPYTTGRQPPVISGHRELASGDAYQDTVSPPGTYMAAAASIFEKMLRNRGRAATVVAPLESEGRNNSNFESSMVIRDEKKPENATLDLLIVDDSALNRKMMVRAMQSLGHTCTEADDGSTGFALFLEREAQHKPFDVILLDNSMPIMTGAECVLKMRQMSYRGIVLGVTGNSLSDDVEEFRHNGADLVIIKPLDVQKFQGALKLLGRRSRRQLV